ncbi:hypothetical protein GCM10009757_20860 [Streptomyces cheonanensis]|uniref:RNA polymerase sigma-70 factor, ECF subfamily n=2 Tax=Streptomyces TaxID=1883 RepID=A0A1I6W7C9_9ACTN|nr:RNA polymerase sigma-70 factor, ECF subfamily [Streptomyces harbinensis]
MQAQVHFQEQVPEQAAEHARESRRRPDRAALADRRLTAALQAAREGDEGAFRQVFHAVHPRLLGYVRTMVTGPDAEDVTAEAWLHISRDLPRFSGDADRFRGWTHRIARNRALDHLRARGRRPQECCAEDAGLTELPAGVDTAEAAMEAVATSRVFDLVATLPREQAGAVVLRAMLGLDAKRAAMVLGSRPGAVRTATHRGLRRLAQLVAERHDHDPAGPPAAQVSASAQPAVSGPVTKSGRAAQ